MSQNTELSFVKSRGNLIFLWDHPQGYAAYRLRVRGLDPERRYALLVSFLDTSYRLLADGSVVISGGVPGKTSETTRSAYHAGVARLPPGLATVELVLEVANFVHMRGGPFQAILLGEEDQIRTYEAWTIALSALTLCLAVIMSGLFFLNGLLRKAWSSISFGLICICGSFMIFTLAPDIFAFRVFPALDWSLYVRSTFVVCYSIPIWFLLLAWSLFGGLSSRSVIVLVGPFALISAFVVLRARSELFAFFVGN